MSRPQFTVAVTFYDVERYLRATLRSLERQTYGVDRLEIVLVDDGSTDGSAAIAERWARGRRNVRLVRQANAGPGAARNRVLEVATGEWYTSVDADDLLDRDYFAAIARVLARDAEGRADLVAPRIYLLDDRTGRYRDRHPLGHKYRFGDRLARLADEPEAFVLGTAFALRTDVLRRHGLTYDPRIVPTFEDAHLIGRYLARLADPVVAVAAGARYLYRKRAGGDSLVQSAWERPERYTVVPQLGYLDLLREAARGRDRAPAWAQCMVLYDVLWYLKEEQSMSSRVGWVRADLAARFLATLDRVMAHVDAATIEGFCANPHPWSTRQALLTRYTDDGGVPRAFRWGDDARGRVQVSLLHRGPVPALRAFRDGVEVEPVVVGTRRHTVFGHELMTESAVRWPSGAEVSLWVDGVPAPLRRMRQPRAGRPPTPVYRLAPAGTPAPGPLVRRVAGARRVTEVAALATGTPRLVALAGLAGGALRSRVVRADRARERRRTDALARRAATPEVRERYRDAWLVMDRVHAADDNGEHLYRYLLRSRPDIDAYFVLDPGSAHWDRLAAEGFRMLAHGGDEARLLALHAAARLSSDAVEACMYPAPRRDFGDPAGIFVFLQHGVTKDDISRWLNSKRIDLLITATEAEHASFVGPGSPYALTSEQVVRTGFARYDRLLALRGTAERDGGVLVMPTWRRPLREALASCRSAAERSRTLESSPFGSAWLALLRHPRLAALADGSGVPVRVLLHPLLADAADAVRLPPHVQLLDSGTVGFQQELVRSRLLLTDYTSVAFDAAFVGLPVVYYQFDRDTMFDGAHPLRAGYFDYGADGFGPVVQDPDAAARAVADALAAGPLVAEPYRSRAARTFPAADGRSCERIVAAVERRIAETRRS